MLSGRHPGHTHAAANAFVPGTLFLLGVFVKQLIAHGLSGC